MRNTRFGVHIIFPYDDTYLGIHRESKRPCFKIFLEQLIFIYLFPGKPKVVFRKTCC